MVTRTEEILRREMMEITLSKAIQFFVATKRTEGRTAKTIDWYEYLLNHFAAYVSENGEPTKLADISVNDARGFVASLQSRDTLYENHPKHPEVKRGLSPYTVHAYVRVLKVFGAWLADEGLMRHNVFERLRRPKLPQPLIEILSDDEIAAILSVINPGCFLGARMYAIVLLLLDTGIRASELVNLTLQNTDIDNGRLKVFGKGRKERMVYFSVNTQKALLRYVHTWRQPAYAGVDNVILSAQGKSLSYAGLRHAIARLGKRAGVPRLHAHLFRHTFAVNYLMEGGDVMTLRQILGHTSLEVTKMYMHLAEAHVEVQYSKFSPVDRIMARRR